MSRDIHNSVSFATPVLLISFLAGLALIVSAMATLLLAPFNIARVFPSLLVVDNIGRALQRGTIGIVLILLAEIGDTFTGPKYVVTENGLDKGLFRSLAVQSGMTLMIGGIAMYFFLTTFSILVSIAPLFLEFPSISALSNGFVSLFKAILWLLAGFVFLGLGKLIDRDEEDGQNQQLESTKSSAPQTTKTLPSKNDSGKSSKNSPQMQTVSTPPKTQQEEITVFTDKTNNQTKTRIYEDNSSSKPMCPDCGFKLLASGSQFCRKCGTRLD